ncbi:MAG: DUF2182 domain-containing protein [Porticoccaceae bacterium]
MPTNSYQSVLRRDRWIVLAGLVSITALAWLYVTDMAIDMDGIMNMPTSGDVLTMTRSVHWTASNFVLTSVMWVVMMVGMMVPGASPMILMFTKVNHKQRENDEPFVPTVIFVAGYITIWSVYSVATAGLQLGLQDADLLSPILTSTSAIYSGITLVVVGLYQLTTIKNACLRHCQTPLSFLTTSWRDGYSGAFRMGLSHGAFCVGCCWALMALLFVGGVMNVLWGVAITIFVFAEKLMQPGPMFPRISGGMLVAWGIWTVAMAGH